MVNNEKTSRRVAKIAAKILAGEKPTKRELLTLAGSTLTQAADRKKRRK